MLNWHEQRDELQKEMSQRLGGWEDPLWGDDDPREQGPERQLAQRCQHLPTGLVCIHSYPSPPPPWSWLPCESIPARVTFACTEVSAHASEAVEGGAASCISVDAQKGRAATTDQAVRSKSTTTS